MVMGSVMPMKSLDAKTIKHVISMLQQPTNQGIVPMPRDAPIALANKMTQEW